MDVSRFGLYHFCFTLLASDSALMRGDLHLCSTACDCSFGVSEKTVTHKLNHKTWLQCTDKRHTSVTCWNYWVQSTRKKSAGIQNGEHVCSLPLIRLFLRLRHGHSPETNSLRNCPYKFQRCTFPRDINVKCVVWVQVLIFCLILETVLVIRSDAEADP